MNITVLPDMRICVGCGLEIPFGSTHVCYGRWNTGSITNLRPQIAQLIANSVAFRTLFCIKVAAHESFEIITTAALASASADRALATFVIEHPEVIA